MPHFFSEFVYDANLSVNWIVRISWMAVPAAWCIGYLAVSGAAATGQGMISGGATARPRPKFSGKPWPVTFVDAAAAAGLNMKFTYGAERKKKFIIEANGSGVAFLDYDNDGRLDVFLVNGSRLEGFPSGDAPGNYPISEHRQRQVCGCERNGER